MLKDVTFEAAVAHATHGHSDPFIPRMAGQAEAWVGNPTEVATSMWALAQDLLERLDELQAVRQ